MTTWGTIDRPDWTDLVSFSNIGQYMLPPVETNYDLVVGNSVTPSANMTFNLGQKDLRYLNVWSDSMTYSKNVFHSGGKFIGAFSGSYNEMRDKPELSQPDYCEILSFFPTRV